MGVSLFIFEGGRAGMLLGTPPERKPLLKYLTGREKKREETMQRGVGRGNSCFRRRKRAAWLVEPRLTSALGSATLRLHRASALFYPGFLRTEGLVRVGKS